MKYFQEYPQKVNTNSVLNDIEKKKYVICFFKGR